jgi:uncharacterized repeat protein (TIGR01451 family)
VHSVSENVVIRLAVLGFAILSCLGSGRSGLAAEKQDVKVELTARQVIVSGDKESFTSAEKAKPGDVIEYRALYTNGGQSGVTNLLATVPIPAGLELVAGSANPVAQQASLDGKSFSAMPLMRPVKNSSGAIEEQPVPLSEYRALRWVIADLAPGATATVTLRGRVISNKANR